MAQDFYSEHLDEAYQLFHEGILALSEAEQQGMRVDVDYIEKKSKAITKKIGKLESIIYESDFFEDWKKFHKNKKINIYSGKQMANFLYNGLGLEIGKRTKSGEGGSTDEDSLLKLGIPELDTFVEIKKLKKIRDTYLAGLLREQVDGVVHTFYNLHLVTTFRGSSDHPNLQNVPIRDLVAMNAVRNALFPRIGHQLMEIDYSQLEVRIAACYHKDPTMLEYLRTDHDMHTDIAKQIFKIDDFDLKLHKKLRGAAKNGFVFPQFYGDYFVNNAKNLAIDWCKLPKGKWKKGQGIEIGDTHVSDLLIKSGIKEYGEIKKDRNGRISEITGFLGHLEAIEDDFWGNRFPIYAKWKENWWKEYQKNGYFVSKTGFLYKGVMSRNDATNYPVQGAAFHVMLWSLIRATETFKKFKMKSRIIGQIHDSIIIDVFPPERDEVIAIMKKIMERDVRKHWDWIIVPLKADVAICPVDGSWAQKEELVN